MYNIIEDAVEVKMLNIAMKQYSTCLHGKRSVNTLR